MSNGSSPSAGAAAPVVLITGAAARLGRAIALGFAHRGWDVAVHYGNSEQAAEETVAQCVAAGRRSIALRADLADEKALPSLFSRCAEYLGEPTCLVNNASRFDYDDVEGFSYARLEALMRINLAAPIVLARELHRRVRRAQKGARSAVVINLLDQKLANLNPDFFSYTLCKSALEAATTMLAQALAPEVRVVGIAPGITLPSPGQSEAGFRKAHSATPLGSSSTAEDIAHAVCFLAEARAITGTTLLVDGGQHLVASARDVMFTNP